MSMTDIAMLVTLSIIWGGSFFFIEILVDYLPPLTIVTTRVGLASLMFWGIIFVQKLPIPKTRQHWLALAVLGLIGNALPFCLIAWGQTQISSGLASIFNATTPFFTVIVAGTFLVDEPLIRRKLLGIGFGILGTIVLIGPEALGGMTGSVFGQLAVIVASISYAFASVYSRRFKEWGVSPLMVATGQVTMATLILLPLTIMTDSPWEQAAIPLAAVGAMMGLALLSTVVAFILFFRIIASAGATNATLVTFLIPISAILLGVTFLDETFTKLEFVGMALIGFGLLVMDGRLIQLPVKAK